MIFGQSLPGAEPVPGESLLRTTPTTFKQSSIFGDIIPWDFAAHWIENCRPAVAWRTDVGSVDEWQPDANPETTWAVVDNDPDNLIIRCKS